MASRTERIDRKGHSIAELSQKTGLSKATIARHTSRTREQWIEQKAQEREAIRAYHDDEGHSWSQTAKHFGLSTSTVQQRARRARKERAKKQEQSPKVA
ncbi:sigma factor-like helix-turn-helix DNA-binding protein [Streptococcus hyovaginalis]|uniref:sigma factor-like helix-turn-helix DNA-binding protein n=1 Tax=Streptococcus hyovaginalis TaxID=149015 RepID=UPI003B3AA155